MRGLRVLSFEKLLFGGETLAVGSHRLPSCDPRFESYGPTSGFFIVFPRNSTMLEYAGGDRFLSSPAVAPLYNRGQEYRRRKISEEGDFCEWFAIAPEVLRELVGRFDPAAADSDRPFRFSHVRVEPRDYLEQRAVVEALSAGAAEPLYVEETMLNVVSRLLARAYRRAAAPPDRHPRAEDAAALLGRTFTENWSLTRIAREVGSSPFHLARSFKRTVGTTIHQHRLVLRLHASLDMLRDGREDISRVAQDLGFADHSHFTAAFRRRFGITPSRYRARATFS
jgi:AraC family transcriptional regulator